MVKNNIFIFLIISLISCDMVKYKSNSVSSNKHFQLSNSLNKISSNGDLIFVSDIEGNAVIYSGEKNVLEIETGHRDLISSPFLTGFVSAGRWDSSVKYWENDLNVPKWEVTIPRSRIYNLAEFNDKILVSYSEIDQKKRSIKDNVILKPSRLIAIDKEGNHEEIYEEENFQIKLIAAENQTFTYATKEKVHIYDFKAKKLISSVQTKKEPRTLGKDAHDYFYSDDSGIYQVSETDTHKIILSEDDLQVKKCISIGSNYYVLNSEGVLILPERSYLNSKKEEIIDITSDGQRILVLYKNKKIEIWEAPSLKLINTISLN